MAFAAAGDDPEALLRDLAGRVEFRETGSAPEPERARARTLAEELHLLGVRAYFGAPGTPGPGREPLPHLPGLQLHELQTFVERFFSPDSPHSRLLLCWDTGTGKSIAAITIAQRFAHLFRGYKLLRPEERPTVFVIGFTRTVIQAEMLRDPRHGLVTQAELNELRRLQELVRAAPGGAAAGSPEARQYHGYVGTLKRTLTDRFRGGYYRFYGYREFANLLFIVTPKGERAGVKVLDLFLRGGADAEGAEGAEEDDGDQMKLFARRIARQEKKGHLRVNAELLGQLRRGLIIADEIHNVYNIHDSNMYGVAIQFVLDAFEAEDAPRAIFMSATPMTGSPAEVVDLLNLLVPKDARAGGRPLTRGDFFEPAGKGAAARLRYRPGALDRITGYATGRVSFLTVDMEREDPEDPIFPEREFVGEPARDVDGKLFPYLKFVRPVMSRLQVAALRQWQAGKAAAAKAAGAAPPPALALPQPADYCLYDMVFPDPQGGPPLYSSPTANPIYARYAQAPPGWMEKNKVAVLAETPASGRNNPVISGEFLALPSLREFSGKYAAFVSDVVGDLRAGRPGKCLVYHDRVQLTGVAFLAEVLRSNGFAGPDDPVLATTLCAVCGAPLRGHGRRKAGAKGAGGRAGDGHDHTPARFGVLAGTLDKSAQERLLEAFNRADNNDGHKIRLVLGSRVIIEALNFKAVRFQSVLSVPQDVQILVQILGRTYRRGSHAGLPPGERRVVTRIYLNALPAGAGTAGLHPPDVVRLTRTMADFELILQGVAALRRPGINGFLPQSRALADRPPSLTGLPFALPLPAAAAARLPLRDDSYYAYGAAQIDLRTYRDMIRALFERRVVWAEADLRKALEAGLVERPPINSAVGAALRADLIDLALYSLTKAGGPDAGAAVFRRDVRAAGRGGRGGGRLVESNVVVETALGREFRQTVAVLAPPDGTPPGGKAAGAPETYYIAAPVGSDGRPVVDVESYLRPTCASRGCRRPDRVRANLREYAADNLRRANLEKRLAEFEEEWAAKPAARFRAILTRYDADFLTHLAEKIVARLNAAGRQPALPPALEGARRVFARFGVFVTWGQLKKAAGFEALLAAVATQLGGRGGPAAVVGYAAPDAARIYVRRVREAATWQRVPLSAVGAAPGRRPENGAVVGYMETRGTALRFKIREPLHVLQRRNVRDTRSLARGAVCETRPHAAQVALAHRLTRRPRGELARQSTSALCRLILARLLEEEEKARGSAKGARWFYLFNETLPLILHTGAAA